ncbi:MAG TPA: heme-binding domain-containing protein [Saprospiraceae bacterium]|nr:heme-binding domain-containing protein [Saprospiraceae bacterium]
MKKKLVLLLLIALVAIQFFPIKKTELKTQAISYFETFPTGSDLGLKFQSACLPCHSDNSVAYPWYASVQPIGWWLQNHVKEGKQKLNFSSLHQKRAAVQKHKLEELVEMVREKEMPLKSYTFFGLHPEAKMTESERTQMIQWATKIIEFFESSYPPDSLILKR